MQPRITAGLVLAVLLALAVAVPSARTDDATKNAPANAAVNRPQARKAIELGLAFLEKDAKKWRDERQCATCHHGTMTAWAFAEVL